MTAAEPIAQETHTEKPVEKRRALGRGLDSLLPSGPRVVAGTAIAPAPLPSAAPGVVVAPMPAAQVPADAVMEISLEQIDANPYQTRSSFEDAALRELADSILASGVVQPVVVRPARDGRYLLILGERRCRASKLAGKATVPAIVRRVSDQQAAEMTVVENLQRQDLNCLEQAMAYARLSQEFGLTQQQIGQRVGVSRESVSNYMRMLKLPETVQHYLRDGQLEFSQARVLLTLVDPEQVPKIADTAIRKHLSVQQLEELVAHTNVPVEREPLRDQARRIDPNVAAAQTDLERILGVRVRIKDRKGRGKIVIEYATLDDFDRVVEMLGAKP
jgi:ParB family chromosome partitioning protein